MLYKGSCHCGKISYEVDGTIEQVINCNCSICTKKGYLLWFVPRTSLKLQNAEDEMATYTFNTHKIKHRFCSQCGVGTFGFGTDKSGAPMAAINVRCLEGVDLNALQLKPVNGKDF